MNLLTDIKNLLKDDGDHHLKIEIDTYGVTVYLIYDPEIEDCQDVIMPIHYTTIEEFCYIPHDDYCKMYKPTGFGIDSTEIHLICKIMDYLEEHKKEINELCYGYDITERQSWKEKNEQ